LDIEDSVSAHSTHIVALLVTPHPQRDQQQADNPARSRPRDSQLAVFHWAALADLAVSQSAVPPSYRAVQEKALSTEVRQ
jgi:hypothetical protein